MFPWCTLLCKLLRKAVSQALASGVPVTVRTHLRPTVVVIPGSEPLWVATIVSKTSRRPWVLAFVFQFIRKTKFPFNHVPLLFSKSLSNLLGPTNVRFVYFRIREFRPLHCCVTWGYCNVASENRWAPDIWVDACCSSPQVYAAKWIQHFRAAPDTLLISICNVVTIEEQPYTH